eukprot:4123480-Heterocapsa_arctica.AAC.1
MAIDNLNRKCEEHEHDHSQLKLELENSTRITGPRTAGEHHPDIVKLVTINKRMIHHCQTQEREIEQVRRDMANSIEDASNTIMNWETEVSGLNNTIRRLEDDLQDHKLDLASRAPSPDRGSPPRDRGTNLASMTQTDVLAMIDTALVRERGRSPPRYNLAAGDGTNGSPRGTDEIMGGEGNPMGGNYDGYDADLN